MWPIATNVASSIVLSVSVCVCIGQTGELCKNGRTDRDAIWGRTRVIQKFLDPPPKGHFWGDTCWSILTSLHMSALCTVRLPPLANVPAYRTQQMNAFAAVTRRRCGLLSNYFGRLFISTQTFSQLPHCFPFSCLWESRFGLCFSSLELP